MIKGSLVALVTPMFDNGSVDFDSLKKLVDFHVEAKTDAIISVGTSGESATLQGICRRTDSCYRWHGWKLYQ